MFARQNLLSSISRAAVMATVAAVALTTFEPSTARAGSAPAGQGLSTAATSDATDFSARRRYYRGGGGGSRSGGRFRRYCRHRYRHRRDPEPSGCYYYGGGPVYYGGGPAYYGGGPVYYGGGHPYYGSQSYSNGGWHNGGNYNGHGGW